MSITEIVYSFNIKDFANNVLEKWKSFTNRILNRNEEVIYE